MADSSYDRRRRRRKDRMVEHTTSSPRKSDESQLVSSKPPVKILGLVRPNRTPCSDDSSSNSGVKSLGESHHELNESSSLPLPGDSSGEKGPITVLSSSSSSDSRPITQASKSNSYEPEISEARRLSQAEAVSYSGEPHGSQVHLKRSTIPSSIMSGVIDQGSQLQNKLAPPLEKHTKCKLIDKDLQWCESGLELMLDQTDFLVVGTIGLQGCGKSTIMSLLAGNSHQDAYRNYVFSPQTKETKEECLFQTAGIDMFISPERIIFLDTQPMLSAAIMDCLLQWERKVPSDYSSLSNYVEMQSMQVLTYLLSVCNILLVADDWFIDVNLLRFIQDAEMLKPPQQSSSSSDNPASKEDSLQFFPTVIFVHNKATREDFTSETYLGMQRVLHNIFVTSKLRYRSGITMTNGATGGTGIINLPPGVEKEDACDVNLLLLPAFEFYRCEPEWLQTTIPDYRGYPSFNTIFSFFRSQVLASPRSPLTNAPLTEKNWYHFAARMWDSVRKSSLLSDYNRLLSTYNNNNSGY